MNIIIIDDDKIYRQLLKKYLKDSIFNSLIIDEASNFIDSSNMIENNNYDAIILDLYLPDSKGIETIKRMMKHLEEINKNIPVLILTGHEDYSIGKIGFDIGIREFLIKDETKTKELNTALSFATYKDPSSISA